MPENYILEAESTKVPHILEILVDRNLITIIQKNQVLDLIKTINYPIKLYFDILEEQGTSLANETKDEALIFYAQLKIQAAYKDALNIQRGNNLDFKNLNIELIPNNLIENPSKVEVALTAADIALFITLILNGKQDLLNYGINAIKPLTRIVFEIVKNNEQNPSFLLEIKDLIYIVITSLKTITDKNKELKSTIDEYLHNSLSNIEGGLDIINKHTQALEKFPQTLDINSR